MKLRGRDLTTETSGADVALLQRELRQLNFTIPDDEAERSFFGPDTLKAVQEFQRQRTLKVDGLVGELTVAAINDELAVRKPRVVRGTVTHDGGAPAPGLSVLAFDRDLRHEEPLGHATTSADGSYEISYTARQFRRAEKDSADLVVRVMGRDNRRVLLSSEVIFNAAPVEIVDFILDEGGTRISEFERYLAELRPLLGDVQLSALDERDITFLEGETGIDGLHLAYLSIAHRHAAGTRIPPEVFYGLFRQDLPTNLPSLFLQRPKQLRRALELSIEQNIIPARLSEELPRILDALRRQVGQAILRNPDGGASSVPRLLGAAGLSEGEQEAFLDSYLQHDGTIEDFWRSLATTPLAPKVQALQATLQLGLLTRNNAPLVSALQAKGVRSMRDLPRLGRDGLRQLILGSEEILDVIDKEEGETNEQRAARFADGMLEVLRVTAPTAFVRATYERSDDPVRRDVARVLENAPELELRDADVDRFLSDNPGALANITDPEPVRRQLKRVQRVLRIAPDAEHAEALMAEGLDSAQAIAGMSPDAFAEQFGEKFGGEARARSCHQRAGLVTDVITGVIATLTQSMHASPGAIARVPDSVKELPNFTTLFGSQSFCSCEHCASVLSPAAYLVDLLQFINPRSGQKPIAELRRRRPDIEHIPLTCENTNTPLPYVDLVNEVLEFYVANGELTEEAARDTKGMTAAELSINPQYVIDKAYETLAEEVYPPILPFHRPLAVARLYLEQMGSSRHELMETFRRDGRPSQDSAAGEFLNLSVFERNILIGLTFSRPAAFYGFAVIQNPGGIDEIKAADFLRRTGITYEELQELLKTRYLDPDGNIKLEDDENPPRCDLEKMTLKNLTPDFWRRAHRFIRLRRKLGWSTRDLDRAFEVLQQPRMTLDFLRKLSTIEKLREQLRLPTPVLLSFWDELDTKGPDSLYARLFLNKAVLNPTLPAFRVFGLDDADNLLTENVAPILAALRLNASDFEALTRHLELPPLQMLNLPLLSSFHRYVALARALRLSIRDLLSLVTLSGENPFQPGNPDATLQFVEMVRLVKESGFTVAQLSYTYLSETPNSSAPTDASVRALFISLRDGLRRITEEAPQLLNPTNEDLKRALPLVVHEKLLAEAEAIIEKALPLDADDLDFIGKHFTFLTAEEVSGLVGDPTPDARRTRVIDGIFLYLRRDFVLQTLSESLRIESQLVGALIETVLVSQSEPSQKAIQEFLKVAEPPDEAFDDPEAVLAAAVEAFRPVHLRLHKAALLVIEFGLGERELIYLHEHALDFGNLNLNELPLEADQFSVSQFSQWQRLARYVEIARSVPQRDATLIDVFEAPQPHEPPLADPRGEAINRLKLASGWDSNEVDFLVGPGGCNLAAAADFRNEEKLVLLGRCIRLSNHLGVSCSQLFRWAGEEPDAAVANEIVSAAKAKYDDERWPAVAKPLNDTLRESRKDALIAYTLDRKNLADSNQLFERFLIDVEMSACMKTSRIKQAISSVQLFIQRCLMNLESRVSPSAIDEEQWEWMKNYRVWEANRKVFLYPENWIEPELRDDKSPIFRELESELMQGDLDAFTAEGAFVHYLEKLDRVARLEPCGLYVQEAQAPDEEEVVHVFGRTVTEPRVYYYRRLINGRTWTPWDPVDLDIEGDHLMPIVHDRRLYLFWLRFEEKQNQSQQFKHGFISSEEHYQWISDRDTYRKDHKRWDEVQKDWKDLKNWYLQVKAFRFPPVWNVPPTEIVKNLAAYRAEFTGKSGNEILDDEEPKEPREPAFSNQPPLVHWEIKLSWGEYEQGGWTAKRTSTEFIISPMVTRDFGEYADSVGKLGDGEFQKDLATSWGTVAALYLPEEHTHFVTTEVTQTGLVFYVNRRYRKDIEVHENTMKVEQYEALGGFDLHCGSKVKAISSWHERSTQIFSPLDFFELDRPVYTMNYALTFRSLDGNPGLSLIVNEQQWYILKRLVGGFSILHEYAHLSFKPPSQDFFYQDSDKTYYVRYQSAIRDVLSPSSFAMLGGSFPRHDVLATSLKQRIFPPRTGGQFRSGAKRIVVNNRGQQPEANTLAPVKQAEISTLTRAMARAGLTLTKQAQRTFGAASEGMTLTEVPDTGLRFHTFFHPHVCAFTERLYQSGVPGLLSRSTQQLTNEESPTSIFEQRYAPSSQVARPYPHETVNFSGGAYALYNWELFFHIPMLVAVSLTKNQRFADALHWFHFVFNPMTSGSASSPERYWMTLPFFNNSDPEKDQIRELLLTLAERGPGWKEIEDQIAEWLDNPFNPHLIARMRITAYQKNVVMKYIDTLIAWGDQLFSRDTLESINEATLLYVLAYNILGPRPKEIPKEQPAAKTYADLEGELDAFGNALVEVENAFPNLSVMPKPSWSSRIRAKTGSNKIELTRVGVTMSGAASSGATAGPPSVVGPGAPPTFTVVPDYTLIRPGPSARPGLSAVRSLYFCVPQNEHLLRYWDTVEDRLFKIRHCMNIEGAVRELPLFEPPIDPALLVRAVAAGLDIGSVLNDLFAPLPRYRFTFMLQKAQELCGELKSLGGALLSALEKRDAEALSNLRARHETSLLKEVKEVRRQQVAEAKANIEALNKTFEATQHRRTHYENLLAQGLIAEESQHIAMLWEANDTQSVASDYHLVAQGLAQIPDITTGVAGWSSPVSILEVGGSLLSAGASAFAKAKEGQAADESYQATLSSIMGEHRRRAQEWAFQVSSTNKEIAQISKQILAAEIRQAIAEKELENHERQIENSEAVEEFLRSKYTNEELYSWMTTQVSQVYFQTYKLATDLAKRAERSYKFELGLTDSNFVQFGYWDSLKKGLLAGEQLSLDLKRMEAAYLEQNKREYEITKHVSLLLHNPLALITLKETGGENGSCTVSLPETLFDMDYPGHYMRRLKSVSLSIPCVTGPYTSVNCTLTLKNDRTRITSVLGGSDDQTFVQNFVARQSIATSHAQNDAGVFELNFRDERYLPFEGAGADSEWQIELPKKNNAFDFDTISDVVLHLKYTARDGGAALRAEAQRVLDEQVPPPGTAPLARLFSLRNEFPTEWHRFLHQPQPREDGERVHRITLNLRDRFPFLFRGREILVQKLQLYLKLKDEYVYNDAAALSFDVFGNVAPPEAEPLNSDPLQFLLDLSPFKRVPAAKFEMETPLEIALEIRETTVPMIDAVRMVPTAVEDIWLICEYTVAENS